MSEFDQQKFEMAVDEMPADVLQYVAQAFAPWQSPSSINNKQAGTDADGFALSSRDFRNFSEVQKSCWEKSLSNPHLNSHLRDVVGSLTGHGWDISSQNQKIDDEIWETMYDIRNELYKNIPKYVARSEGEGELFLAFTVHEDGFVEVDFLPPWSLKGGGDYNSGITFHPRKSTMPLFYQFEIAGKTGTTSTEKAIFPSIYVAHNPDFAKEVKLSPADKKLLVTAQSNKSIYKKVGGFKTFIVAWDKGYLVPRNLSHISTTLEWINHYVDLKKWEIDHKKSAGSYMWVVKLEDAKALRTWLKMTPEQQKATGLTSHKTPGGTLILPPGVSITCENPDLPTISEGDTDIMHMITSGLNKPEDMVTGQTKGDTFSGVKASRGPQADRTLNEIAFFERFLRYDFFRGIFLLKNKIKGFPEFFKVKKAIDFANKEAKFKEVNVPVFELIEFDFPTSEIGNVEETARALMGVKHASVVEVLGIPRSVVAKKLGFGRYIKNRLQYATEDENLPDLPLTAELDSIQEGGEPTLPEKDKDKDKAQKSVKLKRKLKTEK